MVRHGRLLMADIGFPAGLQEADLGLHGPTKQRTTCWRYLELMPSGRIARYLKRKAVARSPVDQRGVIVECLRKGHLWCKSFHDQLQDQASEYANVLG